MDLSTVRTLAREAGPAALAVTLALAVQIGCGVAGAAFLGSAIAGFGVGFGGVAVVSVMHALPAWTDPYGPGFWRTLRRNGWPMAATLTMLCAVAALG